jgi:large subunit ribosomal protein L24
MSKWIKKGDKVLIIAGNDKGKVGDVLKRVEGKVVVEGVNVRKRHLKSRDRAVSSRIVEMEKPIDISNVALCDSEGLRIKLKVRQTSDGKKELYYLREEREIVHRQLRKG